MKVRMAMSVVAWIGLALATEAKDPVRDCVVKIHSTQRLPDFFRPWTKATPREGVGSGAVIEGNRILTAAHVVAYATEIYVQPNESTDKLPARVEAIAHDMDLAVLKLADQSFFAKRPPLRLADGIPAVKDKVSAYGYPIGGDQLSITEGIVSRIEFASYYYQGHGLRVQIDAAINPGNSGGPAVSGGRLVGVVFLKVARAENIGYLVPAEEIRTFLRDIADGTYHGKPQIFDLVQTTENPALRDKLRLGSDTGGLMVTRLENDDPAYPLKPCDVIMQVGPHKLDKRGNVRVRDDLWLFYAYMVPQLTTLGKVPLLVHRDGKDLAVEVPVKSDPGLAVPYLNGRYPPYFIYGPMVFSVATQECLRSLPDVWRSYLVAGRSPLVARQSTRAAFPGEQIVILGPSLLKHPLSSGYDEVPFGVVTHLNDKPVKNLVHLVEMLRDAKSEYLTFQLGGRYETLVFRRAELDATAEEILANEGIRSQCSEDLRKIWNRK